jgi:hypothetical protein
MTNEALETHVVRRADLLLAARKPGERVAKDRSGDFYRITELTPPVTCRADEGDCADLLRSFDGRERFSLADSTDLATRETMVLEFDRVPEGDLALVIACRQSLLSTYLFYQLLSYVGGQIGPVMAALQRGDPGLRKQIGGIGGELGGIEVQVKDSEQAWVTIAEVNETGPLATDVHLVRLPVGVQHPRRIRLRMTKGHWRLDYVALAHVIEPSEIDTIPPSVVMAGGDEDVDALGRLLADDDCLVTYPGDRYELVYRLPGDADSYELFLQSRGYYLEWMREEWMVEEDLSRAAWMLMNPGQALKDLAPEYKAIEPDMESYFWSSRYAHPIN